VPILGRYCWKQVIQIPKSLAFEKKVPLLR
jgi:hypothetical protein